MARGQGKPGFCKICAHPEAHRFILGAREGGKSGKGWNAAEAREAGQVYGLEFDRATWYKHREHALTAEQRIVQKAVQVREEGALSVAKLKRTQNKELLEAIVDIGMQRALDNPDDITIDHALKAVQIMESKKDNKSDSLNILVQFVTGQPPAVVVEGTAREIPQEA